MSSVFTFFKYLSVFILDTEDLLSPGPDPAFIGLTLTFVSTLAVVASPLLLRIELLTEELLLLASIIIIAADCILRPCADLTSVLSELGSKISNESSPDDLNATT